MKNKHMNLSQIHVIYQLIRKYMWNHILKSQKVWTLAWWSYPGILWDRFEFLTYSARHTQCLKFLKISTQYLKIERLHIQIYISGLSGTIWQHYTHIPLHHHLPKLNGSCPFRQGVHSSQLPGLFTYFILYNTWIGLFLPHCTKFNIFFFKILFIFRQRGREGERDGEKHQCVVASCTSLLGIWSATQACALTGNRTGNPLVCRPALNPLSHTSQGQNCFKKQGK